MGKNIFLQIRRKERQKRSLIRTNHRVVRSIICQDDVDFVKVGEMRSNTPAVYESKRIYFDNYRTCYASYGDKGMPSCLYRTPKSLSSQKIEDALTCQYHPEEVSSETRPHLLVLTKDNWVVKYDLDTGRYMQKVFLSQRLNYNYLSWNDEGYSFVVKTTLSKTTPTMRAADVQANVLLTMAIFTILPLELQACMQIDKRIFGNDITGAHLEGCNILFTTHPNGVVRFYSLIRIMQEHNIGGIKLGGDFPNGDAEGGKIGEAPHGIPVTVKLTERPPVLFEISCYEHDVQFGGFPWHYMASPRSFLDPWTQLDPSTIKVYNLATGEEAINGTLKRNMLASGTPAAVFHLDGSERIINTRLRSMSVLKIRQRDDGRCEVVQDHVIKPWPYGDDAYLEEDARDFAPNRIQYSHKGRPIKVSHEFWDGDGLYGVLTSQMICNFTCEDELDLTAVVMPTCGDIELEELNGYVTLHDNGTGRLVKMIRIPGEWDDTVEHRVVIDMDTLIHFYKNKSGRWVCEVFRATRKRMMKDMASRSKVKGSKGRRKSSKR